MSNTVKKIKSIKKAVTNCLEQVPEARDNDRLLILKIWAYQNENLRAPKYEFVNFAALFLDGQYIDPESIRRCRQKVQEQRPDLRGVKYAERHNENIETRAGINKI
jgi:hypothetical protein